MLGRQDILSVSRCEVACWKVVCEHCKRLINLLIVQWR